MTGGGGTRIAAYIYHLLLCTYPAYQEPILDGSRYYSSSDELPQWNIRAYLWNRTYQRSDKLFRSKKN